MGKRYYWLKLHNDFFTDKRIKKLRKIAGGDTYTVIYLKMMLKSVNNDGVLEYEGIEGTFAEELALDLDEDEDNVQVTINYLMQTGLLEDIGNGEYSLNEVKNLVGSESASAQRVREYRKRQDALQCNTDVTEVKRIGNAEKEKREEIELELESEKKKEECAPAKKKKEKEPKHKYGEYNHVTLTDKEYNTLVGEYGEQKVLLAIKNMDEYCEMKGKSYKSYYLALRRWGMNAVSERSSNGNENRTNNTEQGTGTTVPADPSEYYTKEEWADLERYCEENREDLPWL
jgi:predicted phage replisome organizer